MTAGARHGVHRFCRRAPPKNVLAVVDHMVIGCLHETGALSRLRARSVHEGRCQSDEARHSREGNAVGESCPRPCLSLTSLGSGVGVTGLILKGELYERLYEKNKETGTHRKG